MLDALEKEPAAKVHSLIVLKDGKIISEVSAPGYSRNIWHLSHSMSKSVTGMAIGLLVDEGRLEISQRLVDFFPELKSSDKRFSSITVEHLLTMTSGVKFSEAGSVTDDKWTESFFSSPMSSAPGESFRYNSMNSYMLARIAVHISGESLSDYLRPRLFEPLGIKNFFWEKSPEGIEKGGWGLYLSAEGWARLGELYLNGGELNGKRIISERWVKESTSQKVHTPSDKGDFDYGYQIWVGRDGKDFLFNGMLGQNVWVQKDKRLVVSLNSGNNELFQKSPALGIIRRELSDIDGVDGKISHIKLRRAEADFFEARRALIPLKPRRTLATLLRLRPREPFSREFEPILGEYLIQSNNAGILPLFVRLMQANYCGGIERIFLLREGERLFFVSREGGVDLKIELGIYGYKETVLDFRGEKYIVRALAESVTEGDRTVSNIELSFPELPNTREISLSFYENGKIKLDMSETPNHKTVEPFFERLPENNPKISFVLDMLEKRLGRGFALGKVKAAFAPSLIGASVKSQSCDSIIEAAELATTQEMEKTKLIVSLIERFIFIDDGDEPEATDEKSEKKRGFFSRLFSKK